jgi:hypothetical protein
MARGFGQVAGNESLLFMPKISWKKMLQSWWGRSLAGAFVGGLLVAFSGVDDPGIFLIGMIAGAITLFLLGRLE